MNHPTVVYPPNRPLERLLLPSKVPAAYENLYFLDVNESGEMIVGSSNVSGAYWEGNLYFYKTSAAAVTNKYSAYYISATTTSDAKFLNNSNKIVLAEDSGHLKLLTTGDGEDCNIECEDVFATNARVEQLASWNTNHKVLSCADTSVTVWDVQNSSDNIPLKEYKNYHTELVTAVDVNKNQENLFVSASIDRRACLWDDRMEDPATVLYQNEFCGLTSIAWNPKCSEHLVAGSESGDIYSLDSRQPKEFVASYCFNTNIHRAVFSASGQLAVCGDVADVLVLSGRDNFDVVYRSTDHTACVRGLAWFGELLYSCGFDKSIIKHVF